MDLRGRPPCSASSRESALMGTGAPGGDSGKVTGMDTHGITRIATSGVFKRSACVEGEGRG